MRDVIFVLGVFGFFAVAVPFVARLRARCRTRLGARGAARTMSVENVIGLVLAVGLLGYLVYALLAPERPG